MSCVADVDARLPWPLKPMARPSHARASDIVETKIVEMESTFAPAIARIRESQSLASDEDRGLLFAFMALFLIKNPGMRSRISKPLGDLALYTMRMEASDPQSWTSKMEQAKREGTIEQGADTEQMRKLLLQGDAFKVGLSVAGHLYFEFSAIAFIAKMLAQRHWILLRGHQDKSRIYH